MKERGASQSKKRKPDGGPAHADGAAEKTKSQPVKGTGIHR